MAASEEAYGAGHPATYDAWDPSSPDYSPQRAAAAHDLARAAERRGQLSEQVDHVPADGEHGYTVRAEVPQHEHSEDESPDNKA